MLHTHLSERNAPQPSLRSWKNELASRRTCGGRRSPVRSAALTPNEAASIASA